MSYRYEILQAAQKDYEESVFWYVERSLDASSDFRAAFIVSMESILKNPTIYKKGPKNTYLYLMRNFPFTIIYTIDHDAEIILIRAIYHQKRNPRNKYR